MRWKWAGFTRWVFLATLMCTFLFLGIGAGQNPGPRGVSGGIRRPIRPGTPEFEAMIGAQIAPPSGMSDLSLAKRENVDFLLTPALLVQEAVSDNAVLTYPEE